MNNSSGIPRVGITPYSRENGMRYIPRGYSDGIERIGAEPVMIDYDYPLDTLLPLVMSLDGLLFSGGGDANPKHYGQKRVATQSLDPKRDQLELALIDLICNAHTPVFGICRGMQILNVAFGGTLKQDIKGHGTHRGKEPIWHEVEISRGTRLYDIVGLETLTVNSYHHQCVDQLAEGLIATAYAPDGTIEAFEAPGSRFLMGVQWHPEKTLDQDPISVRFLEAFREAMEQ